MKLTIHDQIPKEIDITFSLVSVTEKSGFMEDPVVGLFMQFNDKTYNCMNSIRCFKDKESAWATLEPMIRTLLDNCYAK